MGAKPCGVFEVTYKNGVLGEVHVAPCDEEGFIVKPHELSPDCLCEPREMQEDENAVPLFVHSRSQ